LDTNVVLSALLSPGGRLAWLREAWKEGTLVPIVSRDTALELVRALSYPKFGLSEAERQVLLADYLPFAEMVEVGRPSDPPPECRDPGDQIFIDLALAAEATALVSGDKDLLSLRGSCSLNILSPSELSLDR
jgi:putative PIN family toxin of toxin-antitoxin system